MGRKKDGEEGERRGGKELVKEKEGRRKRACFFYTGLSSEFFLGGVGGEKIIHRMELRANISPMDTLLDLDTCMHGQL